MAEAYRFRSHLKGLVDSLRSKSHRGRPIDQKHLLQAIAMTQLMPDRDEASGQYTETYPLEEFVRALQSLDGEAGTQDVADEVGCKYRSANAKLHDLEERGDITAKNVGNAYLWILEE